jgi:thiol-disulfide isomerase/thioredoxin
VTPGYWALAVALAAALTLGLAKHWYDGRFRATPSRAADGIRLTRDDIGADLGGRATLVQFSTAFCAPCRATRQVLRSVAGQLDGVEHVEVDAESTLELVAPGDHAYADDADSRRAGASDHPGVGTGRARPGAGGAEPRGSGPGVSGQSVSGQGVSRHSLQSRRDGAARRREGWFVT